MYSMSQLRRNKTPKARVSTINLPSGLGGSIRGLCERSDGLIFATAGSAVYCIDVDSPQCKLVAGSSHEAGLKDGSGTEARFDRPCGLAIDSSGNVIVADSGNNCLRRISFKDPNKEAGEHRITDLQHIHVSTYAGSASEGHVNGERDDARFSYPQGVAIDKFRNIYVSDSGNSCIRIISAQGNEKSVCSI